MISYVLLGTSDMPRACAFYDQLLATLGARRGFQTDRMTMWASAPGQTALGVVKPYDGNAASVGNGVMVSLAAASPEQVDALHRQALELGGTDEGAPGMRGGGPFYIAYFRDLDGNKLAAFCVARK